MKTDYRPTHKPGKGFKKVLIIAILILLLVSIFTFGRQPVSSLVADIGKPIWNEKFSLVSKFYSFFDYLKSKEKLAADNRNLRAQVRMTASVETRNRLLEQENRELKSLMGLSDSIGSFSLASILAKPPQSPFDTVVLDIGTSSPVGYGDLIVVPPGFLIGSIKQVNRGIAKGLLTSAPGNELDVLVGEKNVSTTAYGLGGENYYLELPRDTVVSKNDLIYLPGNYPIIVGEVNSIERSTSSPFQKVFFRSPINLNESRWVWIIETERE